MRFWTTMVATLAALVHGGIAAAQSIKPGTTWINQFESTLAVDTVHAESGALRGTYISRLGQHCVGTKHEAVGWVDGDRVVFSVRWKTSAADCKSITSWAGYLVKGKIVAFWDLVYVSGVDGTNFVHRGTDIFEPCVAGQPKGCPQAADSPRPPEDGARGTAEQKPGADPEAARRAEEEASRIAAEQKGKPAPDARRQAEAAEVALRLTGRDRRRLQVALTALGFDTHGVDEVFGPRTRQMIAAWQKRQAMPDTGFLTAPQVALLQRQAAAALARYDTTDRQAEERRKAEEEARRRVQELGDGQDGLGQPPAPVAGAGSAGADATGTPRSAQYRGSTRSLLYAGDDPKAFVEYSVILSVTDGSVSAVVTRYCPVCDNEGGGERKTFTCAPDRLRGRNYNLRCDDAYIWGNLDRARVHYSSSRVEVPLMRAQGPGG